jgi:DMSO/TMAO reductase YedYZ molybdopterin-dependent catalytic subunit
MEIMRKPSVWVGLLVGALVTAPIIALFFLGDTLAQLPLPPLDAIDFAARVLPGDVITFGIDTMVGVIRGLDLGRTDTSAKLAEQMIGTVTLFITGVVASGVLFAVLNRMERRFSFAGGLAVGLVLGLIFAGIHLGLGFPNSLSPLVRVLWIVGVFLLWGLAIGWIYNDLRRLQPVAAPEASAQQIDRRQFLVRVGGATATLTVLGAGLSLALRPEDTQASVASVPTATPEPASTAEASSTAEAAATEEAVGTAEAVMDAGGIQPAPGTRPEYTPLEQHYRIDIASRPIEIDGATWELPITGLVENPMTLTLDDIRNNYEARDLIVTMSCISNPLGGDLISTTRWTGVPFKAILDEVQPTGRWMKITCADGFDEVVDLELPMNDESIIIAYEWDGQPLLPKHGFPIRIHIPERYGMKQPKWITGMEVIEEWEEGYWVRRGWSKEAMVNTTSVIDTVASTETYEEDGTTYVPIGGIAYASIRGISKVEVSIDEGDWQEAQLREPLSDRSWVIWRYDWAFERGAHNFRVRAYDGNGDLQVETPADVRPDGATGIHRLMRIL